MAAPYKFNEKKATQVAARFLAASGKPVPYMKLLKLMYFVDRKALERWAAPVTNDRYFSMNFGPVLSSVYDLMVQERESPGFWELHISSPANYQVRLIADAGDDQLSPAEELLIDEIYNAHGKADQWKLSKDSHEFPEWTFPDGSSIPIELEAILTAVGFDEDEATQVAKELRGLRKMHALAAD